MIKVGIIGGAGYTGVELLRLLVQRPDVELKVITSRGDGGGLKLTGVNSRFTLYKW